MRPRPWSGKLSALENLIAREKSRVADGFLQYVLSERDRSVLRRVLTLAGEFLQLGARSDRVCDGLPENGRMRVSLYAYGMVITQSL